MSRNPEIPLRPPVSTYSSRKSEKRKKNLLFQHLIKLMLKYHFKSVAMFNVDETIESTVQRNTKIP